MHQRLSGLGAKADILIIEDDHSYARLVEIWLSESELLHFSISNAATLTEGFEKLDQFDSFDAILLDLSLPDSHGFVTLEKLINRHPNLNIIVLTGRMDVELGMRAVKSGAQDFLIKGEFGSKELAKSLLYSIERSSILSRLEEAQKIAQVGHWECNPSEGHFYASNAVYRIFGLDIHEPFNFEQLSSGETPLQVLLDIGAEAVEKGELDRDILLEQVDGQQRFVSLHCKPIHIKDNNYVFHGVIQDLTERKQAEELKKQHELAEQTAKVREQVIASVSHEMRTPMNAILGMSNLLRGTVLSEEQQSFVNSIHHSSELLMGIINDILQISELHHKVLLIDTQPFSIHELLAHLKEVMEEKAGRKGLGFTIEVQDSLNEQVIGDKTRLSQILYNLVGNAIKFTDEGEVSLGVKVIQQQGSNQKLRFTVKDSGIGIPADKQQHVFEPFTRLHQKGRVTEGTGLGLTITKQLVEAQGGNISLQSAEGVGATFFVDLTFGKIDEGIHRKLEQDGVKWDEELTFSVLVVEDHLMNQVVVKKTLQQQWSQIKIVIANNGKEAIDYLREQGPFDIILMDLQMPIMDGFDTAKYIREQMSEPIASLPILAMTAHAHISEGEKYKEFGMNDYLLKPFDPQQLFEKIVNYLDKTPSNA
ncbi:MAG: response regulator [Saprospiraceae bacterium]|nr:response regulator [Saprospiraceae bacterium]